MELFDFINIIFTNPKEYEKVFAGEKRRHFFMCQRRFSINFPMQANALQHIKVNQSAVIDFWHIFLRKQFNKVPGWMYVKGVKKNQEIKEKNASVSNELIKEYCKYMKIDRKSVEDALLFYNKSMIEELKKFEELLKQK